MESFGKMVEIIVTIILLFLVPLQYMAIKQDSICQTYVTNEVTYFVDSVRNSGFLTGKMYTVFLKKLEASNQSYEIELIHYKQRINPGTEEEEISENQYNYYGTYTQDILRQLYDITSEKERFYEFNQGDYFTVRLMNRSKTLAARLQELFLQRSLPAGQIMVVYGGAIRDEAY